MKLYIFKSSVYVQYGCYIRLILYQIKYEVLDLIKCMLSIISFFLFFFIFSFAILFIIKRIYNHIELLLIQVFIT